jgi:hypothetical protein
MMTSYRDRRDALAWRTYCINHDICQVLQRARAAHERGDDPDPADMERIRSFLHDMMELEKVNAMH